MLNMSTNVSKFPAEGNCAEELPSGFTIKPRKKGFIAYLSRLMRHAVQYIL
jgi:hypothetical protein